MIDLSPQPHDPGSAADTAHSIPRHDPLPQEQGGNRSSARFFSLQRAEGAIQLLSRWAGPAALVLTLVLTLLLIGWLIIR